jgi:hypothetical protein
MAGFELITEDWYKRKKAQRLQLESSRVYGLHRSSSWVCVTTFPLNLHLAS